MKNLVLNSLLSIALMLVNSSQVFALSQLEVAEVEKLIEKHRLTDGMSQVQKYRAFSVLAYELELFGHLEKSIFYYKRAIENRPKDQDPLEVYTGLLSVLYKVDNSTARDFFLGEYKKGTVSSQSKIKKDILSLWEDIFAKKHNNDLNFYSQFFKDRDTRDLIISKKYKAAFLKLSPVGLEKTNINKKLEYDILSKLKGKRAGFFCQSNLKKYPNSSSVTMEICRFLKKGKLKYGTLKQLEIRSAKELPHLNYLFGALFDLAKEKR